MIPSVITFNELLSNGLTLKLPHIFVLLNELLDTVVGPAGARSGGI